MKNIRLHLIMVAIAVSMICNCAHKGPILVNLWYKAPAGLVAWKPKVVVGISPFKDERGTSASVLGKKSTSSAKVENDIVVQGTVAELVTSRFKDALEARGSTVMYVPEWNTSGEQIEAKGADIVIGGEIKTLWVGVVSKTVKVHYKADVQIRVSAANTVEKKILRRLTLSCQLEREDVSFSPTRVEKTLSEVLSCAIDQLLNDQEFKKSIQ